MRKNPYHKKFIAFEGTEGGGKTTQVKMLVSRMKESGYPVFETKEPTDDGVFGKLVRFIYTCQSLHEELPRELAECLNGHEYQLLKKMMDNAQRRHLVRFEEIAEQIKMGDHASLQKLLQLGMTFDRHDHRTRVEMPALDQGMHVISDRDFPSTPAYAAADNLDWRELFELQFEILGDQFIVPDLILFLDVPVSVGLERTMKKQQGRKEYFDTEERLVKIQKAYYELFDDPRVKENIRVVKIDGATIQELVHEEVWKQVISVLREEHD